MTHLDKFGNAWPDGPGYENEYCPECGQPDNCGDCTHDGPPSPEDVLALGGKPAGMPDDPCDCPNGPTFHQANTYCTREDTA